MQFPHPDGEHFDIPDEWWTESGMSKFRRQSDTYAYKTAPEYTVELILIQQIVPIRRNIDHPLDFGGFERERLVRILRGFIAGDAIEPVKLTQISDGRHGYALYDGMHRYHAAVAAGFISLPAIIGDWGF